MIFENGHIAADWLYFFDFDNSLQKPFFYFKKQKSKITFKIRDCLLCGRCVSSMDRVPDCSPAFPGFDPSRG